MTGYSFDFYLLISKVFEMLMIRDDDTYIPNTRYDDIEEILIWFSDKYASTFRNMKGILVILNQSKCFTF